MARAPRTGKLERVSSARKAPPHPRDFRSRHELGPQQRARLSRLAASSWLSLALVACGSEARPDPGVDEAVTDEAVTGEATAPATPVSSQVDVRPPDPPIPSAALPAAPGEGCTFAPSVTVWPTRGWVDVAWSGRAFVVGGVAPTDGEGEEAFLVAAAPGAEPRTLARARLDHPALADRRRAAPAIAIEGTRGALAIVDGDRRLLVAAFDPSSADTLALRSVAQGASLRFAPALIGHANGWAAAFTDETGTPMRVRGLLTDRAAARSGEVRDLTPTAGGGAAPTFVEGASPARLVFLDPRVAVSVAHAVEVGPGGFGPTTVARPLGGVAEPPETTAAHFGGADWMGYTGLGSVATSAVGLIRLEGSSSPTPLVSGTGYGVLHVDVASLGAGAVFAADAPTASPPDSPREVHVEVVGADGVAHAPVVLRGPGDEASRARVATEPRGAIAVAFVTAEGVHLAIGRCALP